MPRPYTLRTALSAPDEGVTPRCLQVWWIRRELLEELGWYDETPKDRFVLVAVVTGAVTSPAHVYLVERTTQRGAYAHIPPARLTTTEADGRTIHYVFQGTRFRCLRAQRVKRDLERKLAKDLDPARWPHLRDGIRAAPPNWRPLRRAWNRGGCPDPRRR